MLRVGVKVLLAEIVDVGAREGQDTGQQFVSDDAERVDVRGDGGSFVSPALGGSIWRRQGILPRVRCCGGVGVPRDTEVGQTPAAVQKEHVLRLEVAVTTLPSRSTSVTAISDKTATASGTANGP
jgi:hypothetical protein